MQSNAKLLISLRILQYARTCRSATNGSSRPHPSTILYVPGPIHSIRGISVEGITFSNNPLFLPTAETFLPSLSISLCKDQVLRICLSSTDHKAYNHARKYSEKFFFSLFLLGHFLVVCFFGCYQEYRT